MITINKKEQCVGCGACENTCPKKCIELKKDTEGFAYPQIDTAKCVDCGLCKNVCPVLNSKEIHNVLFDNVIAYAAYNKNESIRLESSSGGIFSLIAEYVIDHNGIVFGAAFNEKMEVHHIAIENKNELYRLRGSKYVQSSIGSTYSQVLYYLKNDRMVLFTGTPCQVEGLKSYLRCDYDNLLCVDFICHGVPSPLVWQKYVNYRETKAKSQTHRTFFRHKKYGWKTYSVRFEFKNRTEYEQIFYEDLFMRGFLADLCLRPSCYECKFKKINRVADITLADFWGIENISPGMDDDKGTSLCILHSEQSNCIFNALTKDMEYKKVNIEEAIRYNPALIKSAILPQKRSKFMGDIVNYRFDKVMKKYSGLNFTLLLKKIIRKIIKYIR